MNRHLDHLQQLLNESKDEYIISNLHYMKNATKAKYLKKVQKYEK